MKKAILILLVFIGAQVFSVIPLSLIYHFPRFIPFDFGVVSSSNAFIGMSVILSNTIAVLFVFFIGVPRFGRIDIKSILLAAGCTIPLIFFVNIVSELLKFPDLNAKMFDSMKTSILCLFAIVIVGPVCEELVFRSGIMVQLMKKGMNPAVAILTSALVFGLVHVNPSQVFGAFLIGILFGWLFYVSGNILVSIVVHIANNALAVALMFFQQPDDCSITELAGGALPLAIIAAFCLASTFLIAWMFKIQIKKS